MNASSGGVTAASSLHIVVAEDDDIVRDTLQRLLETMGHTVETVTNGRELVKRCVPPAKSPDVVITDLTMPELGGIEAIEQISKECSGECSIPFVALSGSRDLKVIDRAMDAGCIEFIVKPPSAEQLQVDLFVACSNHRRHQRMLAALTARSDKISQAKLMMVLRWRVPWYRVDDAFENLSRKQGGDEKAADSILLLATSVTQSPEDRISTIFEELKSM